MAYSKWEPCSDTPCRKCQSNRVNFRIHTSSDEAHEDAQFECVDCGATWWVEGSDY